MLRISNIVKLALIILIILCVFMIIKLQIEFNDLQEEKISIIEQNQQLNNDIARIQNDLDANLDEDHIVKAAKEKYNLRLPEEIIFYNDLDQ